MPPKRPQRKKRKGFDTRKGYAILNFVAPKREHDHSKVPQEVWKTLYCWGHFEYLWPGLQRELEATAKLDYDLLFPNDLCDSQPVSYETREDITPRHCDSAYCEVQLIWGRKKSDPPDFEPDIHTIFYVRDFTQPWVHQFLDGRLEDIYDADPDLEYHEKLNPDGAIY